MAVPSSPFLEQLCRPNRGKGCHARWWKNKYASRPPSQVSRRFPEFTHPLSTRQRLVVYYSDRHIILNRDLLTLQPTTTTSSLPPPPQCLLVPNILPARVLHQVAHYQPCPNKGIHKASLPLVSRTNVNYNSTRLAPAGLGPRSLLARPRMRFNKT